MFDFHKPHVFGTQLSEAEQRRALAMFVHRYTGDHKPAWAMAPRVSNPDSAVKTRQAYPLQFASDKEWLMHTSFNVRGGKIVGRECYSRPTWPNNPELRTTAGRRVGEAVGRSS